MTDATPRLPQPGDPDYAAYRAWWQEREQDPGFRAMWAMLLREPETTEESTDDTERGAA